MRKVELRMNEEYKYKIIKKKEKEILKSKLVLSEDAHPRQSRCQYCRIKILALN